MATEQKFEQKISGSEVKRTSMILLSIVTVTLNDSARLGQSVESLRAFYGDSRYEHIIIDGGSDDTSQELFRELGVFPNINIYSALDDGLYDAMNKGTLIAKGTYILYLNCGDRMIASPNMIGRWLDEDTFKVPPKIICFNSTLNDKGERCLLSPTDYWPHRMPTSHQGMVISNEFASNTLFRTTLKIAADYELYLKAGRKNIMFYENDSPFTEIERQGIASSHPLESYSEYILVAYQNLEGFIKYVTILRIFIRLFFVIGIKAVLPSRFIFVMSKRF